MSYWYILDGHRAVPEPDHLKAAEFFQEADRTVAYTTVGEVQVSTVFLGLNHNWREGPPLLFETLVSGGSSGEIWRYSTWEEAEAGHARIVALLKGRKS